MKKALRTFVAVLAGFSAAFLLVIAVELFGGMVHPLPKDFGGPMEEMCRHVERYPTSVLAVVVPIWGATAYVGTWIAGIIGNLVSFAIVALLLLAALVLNISMVPYPLWFKVATLLVIPAAIAVAGRRSS